MNYNKLDTPDLDLHKQINVYREGLKIKKMR